MTRTLIEKIDDMSKMFLFPAALLLTLASCTSYEVEGTASVPALDGRKLSLKVLRGEGLEDFDSCEVVHGVFRMKGDADSVMLGSLCLDGESLMPVVVERGKINISIANTGLRVSGTPLNDRLYSFIDRKNALEMRLSESSHREMQQIMEGVPAHTAAEQAAKERETLLKEMNELVKGFVTENFGNPLSTQVFIMYCQSFAQPVITPVVQDILRLAPDTFKEHAYVKEYIRLASEGGEKGEEGEEE